MWLSISWTAVSVLSLTKRAVDQNCLPPLQGGSFLCAFPGLKPRAESCSPFGTKTSVIPVRKIETTPECIAVWECCAKSELPPSAAGLELLKGCSCLRPLNQAFSKRNAGLPKKYKF
jgi:hypothetical protein